MKLIDPHHPFYRPLWRRIAIPAACLGWAGVELSAGATGWALLFGAAGAYAAWVLLLTWPPRAGD